MIIIIYNNDDNNEDAFDSVLANEHYSLEDNLVQIHNYFDSCSILTIDDVIKAAVSSVISKTLSVLKNMGIVLKQNGNYTIETKQMFFIVYSTLCEISKKNIFIYSYPEQRLRPKYQFALTDFFIELSKKKHIIINTYSEFIINRVVKRYMDGTLDSNDFKIIYLDDYKRIDIKTDKIKGIVDAPNGFLTEMSEELRDIMHIGHENLKSLKS